jgi:5-methyltetrahydrofolate--homocysteine methyltransferase
MPIAALPDAGRDVLKLVSRLRDELGVNSICGVSNLSFGLPGRAQLNAAFVVMAYGAGLSSAILNPCHRETMDAIRAADVVAGTDRECTSWIASCREAALEEERSKGG